VVAPNRTIYEKLKRDFSPAYPDKYVFSGLYDFVDAPRIIDGDNFEGFRQRSLFDTGVTINIFSSAKLTHGRSSSKEAEKARVMRLHEVLGQSYFEYLRALPDLCLMMDESHHYHAEQGFGVINDLNPVLGVEFTATPQIQTGRGKEDFKNVVYEYSLAHALNDKMYVKEPVVWTRRDIDPTQYPEERLLDHDKLRVGISLHIDTKAKLDIYARNSGGNIPFVKPFMLVVAKDIAHSRQIHAYLTSEEFFGGYYADKVIEIRSGQSKVESEENTELLLSLEHPDNKIEIVIHVNKLKEGWDVKNLYTIVPLRASASETLTEQTMGRGLRLPFGDRTGIDELDRLSIVCHDKFEAIVELANDPNSLVRRVYYIDPSLIPDMGSAEMEAVELKPKFEVHVSSENFTGEIASNFSQELPAQTRTNVASFVAEKAALHVVDMSRRVSTFTGVKTDAEARNFIAEQIVREVQAQFPDAPIDKGEIRKAAESAIEYCVEALTGTIIPIPELVINPQSVSIYRFDEFKLKTRNLNLRPSDDTIIGQELSEGGRLVEFEGDEIELLRNSADSPEKEVAKYIIAKDNIDYAKCGKLIFSLVAQAKQHFLSYLNDEETEKVMRQQARTIADYIYAQMNEHFHESDMSYSATEIRPFSRIEGSFGSKVKADDIYPYTVTVSAGEVRQKVFKGFNKACHNLYKFDSLPELKFARVLEQDGDVKKWLRPSPRQFNIYWGKQRQKYEPDFIVETEDCIYMCEIKAFNEIATPDVQEKGRSGAEYCRTVSEWNANNGGKLWEYAIIADRNIHPQSSFRYLVDTRSPLEILADER
jgi:type III restriction enzyme